MDRAVTAHYPDHYAAVFETPRDACRRQREACAEAPVTVDGGNRKKAEVTGASQQAINVCFSLRGYILCGAIEGEQVAARLGVYHRLVKVPTTRVKTLDTR